MFRREYDIVVGIGCGREGVHAPQLPIDTVLYLDAAELIRQQQMNVKGAIILADIDVKKRIVRYRERLLRQIIKVIDLHAWTLIKQTQMNRGGIPSPIISDRVPEEDRRYYGDVVKDFGLTGVEGATKVGWVLHEKAVGNSSKVVGGEIDFDREIVANHRAARFSYTQAGIPLRRIKGPAKSPYLSKTDEVGLRICLPQNRRELEVEMEKYKQKISEAGRANLEEFCKVVTRKRNIELTEENLRAALSRFLG